MAKKLKLISESQTRRKTKAMVRELTHLIRVKARADDILRAATQHVRSFQIDGHVQAVWAMEDIIANASKHGSAARAEEMFQAFVREQDAREQDELARRWAQ